MIDELLSLDQSDLTLEQRAGVAIALADHISLASYALEKLKSQIRTDAATLAEPGKGVVIKGVDLKGFPVGEVTVTFPRPQASLNKGFNPTLATLGEEVFNRYFEKKVVLKKDALETLRQRRSILGPDSPEMSIMFSAVDISEPTPRVGFRSTLTSENSCP